MREGIGVDECDEQKVFDEVFSWLTLLLPPQGGRVCDQDSFRKIKEANIDYSRP